jgi:hypothetical protein
MSLYTHTVTFPYTASISIEIPYMAQLSKNRKEIYTKRYTSRKIKNPEHEKIKDLIAHKFFRLSANIQFKPKTPLFVQITVHSKGRSCDAHNFAEGICDALEDAIGVNDRYYTVCTVPKIDKDNPRIRIDVYQ